MQKNRIIRKCVRFSSNAPIMSTYIDQKLNNEIHLLDVSIEGLSFRSGQSYEKGMLITLQIPVTMPTFKVKARVIWCTLRNGFFDTGVQFLEVENGFRIQTVEQLRMIEEYRNRVYFEQGRKLSCEQARAEMMKFTPGSMN